MYIPHDIKVKDFKSIYHPHFKMCDDILRWISHENDKKEERQLSKDFVIEPDAQILSCFDTLEKDGYIKVTNRNLKLIKPTGEGIAFIKIDGYYRKLSYEVEREAKSIELIQSSIDTNLSVSETNKIQKLSLIVTGVAIVVSCAFQILSYTEQKFQDRLIQEHLKSDSLKEIDIMGKFVPIQKQLDSIQNAKSPSVKTDASKNYPNSNQ